MITQANRYGTARTIVLAAAATVLGMEALRVFATNLVWYLGETSDRVVMGGWRSWRSEWWGWRGRCYGERDFDGRR